MSNKRHPLVCKHDVLARSCPHCEVDELERENQELKARLARYTDTRPIDEDGLREICPNKPWINNSGDFKQYFFFTQGPSVYIDVVAGKIGEISLMSSEKINIQIETFGQLTHLLDALGIGGGGDGGDTDRTGGE